MSVQNKVFEPYMGKKVALYGLGAATENVLPDLRKIFQIVGLLDSFTEQGMLYGTPILPIREVLEMPVELIIVVARPGSCKAIAKKIGDACRQHGIALLDIRGKNLLVSAQPVYDCRHIPGHTKAELEQRIQAAEAISFDLFDTLVTRQVLLPTDIYNLMEAGLQKKGIHIPEFVKKRLMCEMKLSQTGAPTLGQIYEELLAMSESVVDISAAALVQLEWELDLETLLPRRAVCEIFHDLVREGKKVAIVSDTFYSSLQLETLLEKCGIVGFTNIFASCEYGVSKTKGLFARYQEAVPAESYLHIGDNTVADIEAAAQFNMDTYRLYSGADLFNEVGELGLETQDTLEDRIKIGLFVSRLFNNPFQFEMQNREITVFDATDIGYLFFAPLLTDFVQWFHEKVQEYQIKNVWFSARDGYLIQKLYQKLVPDSKTVYFLTSRTAAIRAGMENEDDIAYVDSMKFSGSTEDNLFVRFGIRADEVETVSAQNRIGLMRYSEAILEKAKEYRRNYLRYVEKLPATEGTIAFFDFVARGTTQLYVNRLVPNHMKGLYFLQIEPEFMPDNDLDIEPFYRSEESDSSTLFEEYYILETIVTAPDASVSHMDEAGKPVYASETRTQQELACVAKVQDGILEYFQSYFALVPERCNKKNKKLDEALLALLRRIHIADEGFLGLKTEDPFYNRNTDMKVLLA